MPDGSLLHLRAYNGVPGVFAWQLLEECCCSLGTCECQARDIGLAHLIVTDDGRFKRDDGVEARPTDRDLIVEQSRLSVADLVPADALAHVAWIVTHGIVRPCPRCGSTTDFDHDPLCATGAGVPLYPTMRRDEWLSEIDDAPEMLEWDAVRRHSP